MQYSSGKSPTDSEDFLIARQLHQQGSLDDAAMIYRRILKRNPNHSDTLNLFGVLIQQKGKLKEAEQLLRRAAALKHNFPPIQTNLGNVLFDLEKFSDALSRFSRAIELEPTNGRAYYNRANLFAKMKKFSEAIQDYDHALKYFPNDAEVYLNKGNVLRDMDRKNEALNCYDRAIHMKPDYAEAYYNRGNLLSEQRRFDDALGSYDLAIQLQPRYVDAHWNKALALLLNGKLKEGWRLYEWRWKTEHQEKNARNYSKPLWLGKEDLSGKTILLWAEQGFGDTIQFCRYAALVKSRGARVLLEIPQPLARLLKGLPGVDILLDGGQPLPHFDYHCPLLSLPRAFNTELETIPKHQHYLTISDELREKWALKLGTKIKPRIGIAWSGNRSHINDHNRSLILEFLLRYLPGDYEYFCLQKDIRAQDIEVLKKSTIRHFGDQMTDFAATAALCDLMDLVISVDTSVAHLSGAIGTPTWILLPHIPDWRWLLDRDDSPWYPSVRLFRQDRAGAWDAVLKNIKGALDEKFAAKKDAV